jgi:hypothetical protein
MAHQLASRPAQAGHLVTVVVAFPNRPGTAIYAELLELIVAGTVEDSR